MVRATNSQAGDLGSEAVRKLGCYLRTGIEGFRQQAVDRARAIGLDVDGLPPGREGAEQLLAKLVEKGHGPAA